jgi:hypothetical protein
MGKYIDLILEKATWKKGIIFSIIFAFFYTLINFTGIGVSGLLKITGGPNILDFEFGYTHEDAYRILAELGEGGRRFYLTKIVPIDFPFPLSYMLFYAVWTALLLKRILCYRKVRCQGCHLPPEFSKWYKYTLLLPFFAMLFDWIENIGIITLLNKYPNLPAWAVFEASIGGILKIVYWSDLFFNLPFEYRIRSSRCELQKIRTRMEKASSML